MNINLYTFEVSWLQPTKKPTKNSLLLKPSFRYCSPSDTDFLALYCVNSRQDGFYTSDFRLLSFGSISTGVLTRKGSNKRISLNDGFEYTFWRANLKMDGRYDDYAVFDF